jgi:hypothetical protein
MRLVRGDLVFSSAARRAGGRDIYKSQVRGGAITVIPEFTGLTLAQPSRTTTSHIRSHP